MTPRRDYVRDARGVLREALDTRPSFVALGGVYVLLTLEEAQAMPHPRGEAGRAARKPSEGSDEALQRARAEFEKDKRKHPNQGWFDRPPQWWED